MSPTVNPSQNELKEEYGSGKMAQRNFGRLSLDILDS